MYVLNGIDENEIKLSIEKKIIPIINSTDELKILSNKRKHIFVLKILERV